MTKKEFDKLNVIELKEHLNNQKNFKSPTLQKTKKTLQTNNNILNKKIIVLILVLLFFAHIQTFFLFLFILFLIKITVHLENKARTKKQIRQEKIAKYNKTEGIQKRMQNLKQFKS